MAACQPASISVPRIISVSENQKHVFKIIGILAHKVSVFCGPYWWLVLNGTVSGEQRIAI
jgi:hypothetical protein